MNPDDDVNPFADPSIRQATAQTLFVLDFLSDSSSSSSSRSSSNQQTLNEYNPFSNTTTPIKVTNSHRPISFFSIINRIFSDFTGQSRQQRRPNVLRIDCAVGQCSAGQRETRQ